MEIIAQMEHSLTTFRRTHQKTLAELGSLLGVRASTICKWERGRVPAERVLDVERVTGVPRHELRPDLYPAPTLAPAEPGGNDNPAEAITDEVAA